MSEICDGCRYRGYENEYCASCDGLTPRYKEDPDHTIKRLESANKQLQEKLDACVEALKFYDDEAWELLYTDFPVCWHPDNIFGVIEYASGKLARETLAKIKETK